MPSAPPNWRTNCRKLAQKTAGGGRLRQFGLPGRTELAHLPDPVAAFWRRTGATGANRTGATDRATASFVSIGDALVRVITRMADVIERRRQIEAAADD